MHPIYLICVSGTQISVRFALWQAVGRVIGHLIQVHWMTPNNIENYKVKVELTPKYRIFVFLYAWVPNFTVFARYKIAENRKHAEWPQNDIEPLTIKSTLVALNTYHWGPNCGLFCSTSSYHRAWSPNYPKHLTLNLFTQHPTNCLHNGNPWLRPTFWSVLLYDQPFRDTKLAKIGNVPNVHRMTLAT